MLKGRIVCVMGAAPLLLGSAAYIQAQEPESFRVSAAVDARRVSNANLRADVDADEGEGGVSELQTIASLLMLGRLQGRIADFQTDYSFQSRRYSEYPDRNEQLLLGQSNLLLGTADRQHYAEFSHSSREFLVDPTESDLPENRDSRTIISAGGYTSMRLGQPNRLSFRASVSDFQFDQTTENEAVRGSIGAGFMRNVRPLHQAGIDVMGYHLDYREESEEDLDYAQVTLVWQAVAKWAKYSVEVGYNTMERAGETISSPLVRLDWDYQKAGQGLTLNVSQRLSDTTQGSGNEADIGAVVGVDGRVDEIDQFKATDFGLLWSHSNPCSRCTLSAGLELQEEKYYNYPEFSSREFGLRLDAGYRISRTMTLEFRSASRYFFAYQEPDSNDYRASRINLALTFPEVVRDGAAAVFVGVEERDYEIGPGYTSGFIGASFEYVLVSR